MEFLMTYSWAILVVLAAIAALAYFGVLSPSRFLPEKCSLPSGFACMDSTLSASSGARIVLQNSLGIDMTGVVVGLNGTGCLSQTSGAGVSLTNGASATFTLGSCRPAENANFKGVLTVTYANADSGLNHTVTGEFIKQATS